MIAVETSIKYNYQLYQKKVLEQRGVKKDDITISDVTSLSKKLKIVFELKLGFKIAKGSRNTRVVLIPDEWARSDDRDLTEFSEESEDSDDADDNTLLEAIFDNDTHTTDFVVNEF